MLISLKKIYYVYNNDGVFYMSDVILKMDAVLPEDFISNVETYLDEMMKFKREKVVILQDRVIPSAILVKYEHYKALEAEAAPKKLTKAAKDSKEMGMLLAVRSKIHFFHDLKDDEILSLIKKAEFIKPAKDEVIFNQGDFGNEVYFIIKGGVDISLKATPTAEYSMISSLGENAVFGEIGPMLGEVRSARATMATDNALLLSIEFVDTANDENAGAYIKMTKNFIKALSRKLIAANEIIYNL
jgi:CRP-like cAMP-binding protein